MKEVLFYFETFYCILCNGFLEIAPIAPKLLHLVQWHGRFSAFWRVTALYPLQFVQWMPQLQDK